ncbi:MAG: tetratricopeptide repeat protein [Chlorobi bacterium]|nr:tetratricopeptide repeat protein [Chlorobiota bacterium]
MKKQIPNSISLSVFILLAVSILFVSCGKENAYSRYKSGSAKFQLKDYRGAIADFSKAIELKPEYIEAYYSRAICESKLGKTDKALADFNKVTELDPKNKNAVFNRAYYIKQQTGDYKSAVDDYNLYLKLNRDGENAFTYNNLGYCKFMLHDTLGAFHDVMTSIQLDSTNSLAYKNRAEVYLSMDSLEKACNDIEKALKLGFTKQYGEKALQLQGKYCGD